MLRNLPFILLVLACVSLTTMAFFWVREWEEERLLTVFHRTASDEGLALQHKTESTLDKLNSLGAFYAAAKKFPREKFGAYRTPATGITSCPPTGGGVSAFPGAGRVGLFISGPYV